MLIIILIIIIVRMIMITMIIIIMIMIMMIMIMIVIIGLHGLPDADGGVRLPGPSPRAPIGLSTLRSSPRWGEKASQAC